MTAPTTYHLRNESGIEVFTGTIVPAPGGGSQSDVETFAFAFDDAGIADGITFYTPTADDVAAGLWLLDAWLQVDTAFDGTTPQADIGTFSGTNNGLYSAGSTTLPDLTLADAELNGAGVLNGVGVPSLASAGSVATRVCPARITATNPLKIVVSQTGAKGGAAIGGMAGSGFVCYRIGKA